TADSRIDHGVTERPACEDLRQPGPRCAKGRLPSRSKKETRHESSVALLGDEGTSRRLVMTKQGSFKRAVRRRAQETGQRYTQARADLETAGRQEFTTTRPFDRDRLRAHLESQYKIRINALARIDDDPRTGRGTPGPGTTRPRCISIGPTGRRGSSGSSPPGRTA